MLYILICPDRTYLWSFYFHEPARTESLEALVEKLTGKQVKIAILMSAEGVYKEVQYSIASAAENDLLVIVDARTRLRPESQLEVSSTAWLLAELRALDVPSIIYTGIADIGTMTFFKETFSKVPYLQEPTSWHELEEAMKLVLNIK